MKKWKLISSRVVLNEKWFKVRRDKIKLPGGKIIDDYFVWDAKDICIAITITENEKFVLNKQYQHAAGKIMFGFVGGLIEKNETPQKAALREIAEEIGYVPKKITLLGKFWQDPNKKTSRCYAFLAEKAVLAKAQKLNDTEEIETITASYEKVAAMISSGKIADSGMLAAFLLMEKKYPRKFSKQTV